MIYSNQSKQTILLKWLPIILMLSIFCLLMGCNDTAQTPTHSSSEQSGTKTQPDSTKNSQTTEVVAKAVDNQLQQKQALADKKTQPANSKGYRTIEWIDLMPQDDLDALMNPPEFINQIPEGAANDQLQELDADSEYQKALTSTRIIAEFDKQKIKLPGFIVPLEFDDDQTITTLFFVPFFGACLHLPPPPPNQIIYAKYEPGIQLEALYAPFWIEGTIYTKLVENDTAIAAYSMQVDAIYEYTEE